MAPMARSNSPLTRAPARPMPSRSSRRRSSPLGASRYNETVGLTELLFESFKLNSLDQLSVRKKSMVKISSFFFVLCLLGYSRGVAKILGLKNYSRDLYRAPKVRFFENFEEFFFLKLY
jgi:hypothetical protein